MLTLLKLGGSLITDKTAVESPRTAVIERLAVEIEKGVKKRPEIKLIIGHGSGSYGHVAAAHYGTQNGVSTLEEWRGFAEVSGTAARLNRIVMDALRDTGLPVMRFQPSASALSQNRNLRTMAMEPIRRALDGGLIPVVHGDVAFDRVLGGTIISTETLFAYLAEALHPDLILLAGNYEGVYDTNGNVIELITPENVGRLTKNLSGSDATDVTGGMVRKVQEMVRLCGTLEELQVYIFSGEVKGNIERALLGEPVDGTRIAALKTSG